MDKKILLLACLVSLSFTVPALAASAMNQGSDSTVPFIDATQGVGDAAATGMAFKLNGTEMMRVTGTGSVGIGTTTPTRNLHLAAAQPQMLFDSSGGNKLYIGTSVAGDLLNGITAGDSVLRTVGGKLHLSAITTPTISMAASGNVGIGTTNPVSRLEINTAQVSPASVANGIRINETTGGYGVNIGAGSNYGWIQGLQGFLTTSGNNNIAIQPNGGNVGIGTTTPGYKLSIVETKNSAYAANITNLGGSGHGLYINTGATGASTSWPLLVADYAGTNLMWVRADGAGYLKAAAWTYGSDRRIKENIQYFDDGLRVVEKLKPTKFDYIDGVKQQIGFIAQDVQDVIPEAVTVADRKTGFLGLKSEFIVPYLVNAIKELKSENAAFAARLEKLEARVK